MLTRCVVVLFLSFNFEGFSQQVFEVINTNDSGVGSLRQAILDANLTLGEDTIVFNIPGISPHTIKPLNSLPSLYGSIVINAISQPGNGYFGTSPHIILSGENLGVTSQSYPAFTVWSDGFELYGLYITRFQKAIEINAGNVKIGAAGKGNVINEFIQGIEIRKGSNISVSDNLIGTNVDGNSISISSSYSIFSLKVDVGNYFLQDNFTIKNNIIVGKLNKGISISGLIKTINIDSNKIGTDINGEYVIGDLQQGLLIDAKFLENVSVTNNLISGNEDGLIISNSKAGEVLVDNNKIGTDLLGINALPNRQGVLLNNCRQLIFGGMYGNLVSGNTRKGLTIQYDSASVVTNNLIGTDFSGLYSIGNYGFNSYWGAIRIFNSILTQIGNSTNGGNVISGNYTRGISISFSQGISVKNNKIGVNRNGDSLENKIGGIHLFDSNNNEIGGNSPNEGNIIAYNQGNGITLEKNPSGETCHFNLISNNQFYRNKDFGIKLNLFQDNVGNDAYPSPTFTGMASSILTGTSLPHDRIQLYYTLKSDFFPQGHTLIGETAADDLGNWEYIGPFDSDSMITAISINPVNSNTSEFSKVCYFPSAFFSYEHTGTLAHFYTDNVYGNTYFWDFGDGSPIMSYHSVYHSYSDTNYYTITLIIQNQCGSDTIVQDIYINDNLSISETHENTYNIYPNPSAGSIIIDSDKISNTVFIIKDLLGNQSLSISLLQNTTTVNLQNFKSGIYFYDIIQDNKSVRTGKIVVL
jgi:hypothetical protein